MNAPTQQMLWNRIRQFQLDDPEASVKFSDKLARENNWPADFTRRAIDEYRKFMFLCCISPTGASPSAVVDEVWHLHLTYTQNYWKSFCQETLGKEIHHHPSKGGGAEKERHRQWYKQTLDLYKDVFGENPPADIWPLPQESMTASVEDPAPFNYFTAYRKHLYILLIPFLLPFVFGKFHPFLLTGPQFLWFYGSLLLAAGVFLLRARFQKKKLLGELLDASPLQTKNWYAIARFVFGKNRAIQAAVVDLVSKDILVAEQADRLRFYPEKMDAETLAANPLAANLQQHHSSDQLLRMKDMPGFYNEELTYNNQLASLYQHTKKKDYTAFAVSILVMLFGFIRMKQGEANGYPITYLSFMVILGGFVLLGISATLLTSGLFHGEFVRRYQPAGFSKNASEPILSKFVLLGFAALAGSYAFANLENTFRNQRSEGGESSVSSGCGSSGCGSSCGGGCGGCGGGD